MRGNSLLWIVGGVCKNARIKSAFNAITALNYKAVHISLHKFIIEKYIPLCMDDFTTAVSHESFAGCLSTCVLGDEILKSIWELVNHQRSTRSTKGNMTAYSLEVGDMIAQMACRLAPVVFRIIAKEKVAWQELCVAEGGQMSAIRPKHHRNNGPREITAWLSGRILHSAMSIQECWGCVKFAMYTYIDALINRLPKELKWFVMEILILLWVCELLADYGHERSMVQIAHDILLRAGVFHAVVERNGYRDRGFLPPCILIYPCGIAIIVRRVRCIPGRGAVSHLVLVSFYVEVVLGQ
jgi:hypothetical protein